MDTAPDTHKDTPTTVTDPAMRAHLFAQRLIAGSVVSYSDVHGLGDAAICVPALLMVRGLHIEEEPAVGWRVKKTR